MADRFPDTDSDVIYRFAGLHSDANRRYEDWYGIGDAASIGLNQRLVLPADGSVVEVAIISTTSAGSTAVRVHKNRNTTEEELQTVTPATAEPATIATFSANTFVKGDVLTISVDPTNSITNVYGYVRFRPN